MGKTAKVLDARGLFHIYRNGGVGTVALRGTEITLEARSWTAITGPSGSGKSTLLHVLAGLLEPSAGEVLIDGRDVTRMSSSGRAEWRRNNVGVVLQHENLHPDLDILDNIQLPLRIHGNSPHTIAGRAQSLLVQLGLSQRGHYHIHQLSGGELQRAAIAVALAGAPKILLADEPTGE